MSRHSLAGWLPVVEFCAEEVRRQGDSPLHVGYMVRAWCLAQSWIGPLDSDRIEHLGMLIEPNENRDGFRHVGVRVGWDLKPDWQLVPRLVENLCESDLQSDPAEFYHQFEEIHPFRDGNGRTGKVLYNYLRGTLLAPEFPPSFWGDIANP